MMTERTRGSLQKYITRSVCLVFLLGLLFVFISLHYMLLNAGGVHEEVELVRAQHMEAEKVPFLDFSKKWDRVALLTKLKEMETPSDPLLQRKFSPQQNSSSTRRGQFRLMNWNMLAQAPSQPSNLVQYPKLKEAADSNFRRLRILEDILQTDPDVLSLQEVDQFWFFHLALTSVGYEGFYYHRQPDTPDGGFAMFYKESKFNLVEKNTITLGQFTDQVAVILTLEPKTLQSSRSSEFVVATTQFTARGTDDLRQEQGEYLLQYLAKKAGSKPLIVCGDFNAEPSSPVYSSFIKSTLGLHSAYALLSDTLNREPPFTTLYFRGNFSEGDMSRARDYIWFSTASLKVNSLRVLPTPEEIPAYRLAATGYPSNHLSLAADFIIS